MTSYERRCDECRQPYDHVKGAPTGWCPECEEAIQEMSRTVPPLVVDHWHLPLVEEFPDWA